MKTLIIVLLVALLLGVNTDTEESAVNEDAQAIEQSQLFFTLELVDRAGDTVAEDVGFEEGDSLMDALQASQDLVEVDGFISGVNELEANAEDQEFLALSVDGEMAMTGAADIELSEGTLITFALETWE